MKLRVRQGCQELLRILLSPSQWFDVYWPASRQYWFSLLFISVICAKALRIYSHLNSLTLDRFLLWGSTFFLQDIFCILIAQFLCQDFYSRGVRVFVALVTILASLLISCLAAANISFYTQTGAEVHWRQAHNFHRDAASIKTLLTGLTGVVICQILFSAVAWISTPHLYNFVRRGVWTLTSIAALLWNWKRKVDPKTYSEVPLKDWDEESNSDNELERTTGLFTSRKLSQKSSPSPLACILVASASVIVLLLRCLRPSDTAYTFLSQTVVMAPFEKPPSRSQRSSFDLPDLPGDYSWLYNHTALAEPPKLDWLPEKEIGGFRDWYRGANDKYPQHYDPTQNPLHISNRHRDILQPLRDTLKSGNVNIKHVFLLKLESTRYDVFPLRKDSHVADLIRESYPHNQIPDDVEERLANLTRNAEMFTGTPSGFNSHNEPLQPYGGISATNAYTSGTFTLKSIIASVCGISPLVVDFNHEYLYHFYEPCMPQILNALNLIPANSKQAADPHDYTTWPWHSHFMQSITDLYDNQNFLTPAMGFQDKVTAKNITRKWKNKPGNRPEKFNFWGYPENELRGYFVEAIQKAEEDHERIFLTHLTGLTHHPFDLPVGNEYEEMISPNIFSHHGKINRYLNTVGVVDKWLGEIREVLEETGVANETLVVMVGDHGLSVIEDGGVTACDNPHVSNFHVPLVFSHPQLPPIQINDRVTSMQILPTILDLLVESASLDDQSSQAIKDLLPLYEGQSMIRDIVSEKDGMLDWQFTVMNTGATWLALRSASKPYRLVIPLVPEVEWRFTDVDTDPYELHALQSFNLLAVLKQVGEVHGEGAVQWIRDAAHVAQWWVAENWRRYEFVP
ncbi:hypothetical protein N7448_007027 [Penicillium atrosanguineum]|uniref:Sulfatase N-terminal domain-containing protein n=1 Tax=Penicillium atrosanguineum TaxID=1132637 RepID=A0A9W9GZE4_9EURO|nr:hypothetical protein N7448_007027 [Penicillium atrosanguineum]KAJ5141244.1 hypothetical protein N7526_002239 [Penicillium atrosanguineum]KAJ5308358.1 hypothetical protein N7476_009014 [Penicillium atrosanguineum]